MGPFSGYQGNIWSNSLSLGMDNLYLTMRTTQIQHGTAPFLCPQLHFIPAHHFLLSKKVLVKHDNERSPEEFMPSSLRNLAHRGALVSDTCSFSLQQFNKIQQVKFILMVKYSRFISAHPCRSWHACPWRLLEIIFTQKDRNTSWFDKRTASRFGVENNTFMIRRERKHPVSESRKKKRGKK